MKKTKLIIHQPKIKGCDNSCSYNGLIAETDKATMTAYGTENYFLIMSKKENIEYVCKSYTVALKFLKKNI